MMKIFLINDFLATGIIKRVLIIIIDNMLKVVCITLVQL